MGNKYWFLFWRVISCYLLLVIRLQEEVFATGIQDCWSWKWPLESIVSNTPAQKPVFSSSLFRVKSRWDLNIPKDRDLQHGQSVWHLTAHTRNLIFLGLHGIFSVWNLCSLPVALSTTEKGPALSSLLPHQVFVHMGKMLLNLLFPAEVLSPSLCLHHFKFWLQEWRSLH